MTMHTIAQAPVAVKATAVIEGGLLDLAYAWGEEDALSGDPCRPSLYFCFDSLPYAAYNEGYAAGASMRTRFWGGGPQAIILSASEVTQ